MKKELSILILFVNIFYSNYGLSQQIINGDFEQWDTISVQQHPFDWLPSIIYTNPCGFPDPSPLLMQRTTDRNNGNFAVQLKTVNCSGVGPLNGYLANGDANTSFQHGWFYKYRPDSMHFHHKFYSIGNDTAIAEIKLRLLDSVGNAGKIIGEGSYFIIKDTSNYSKISIPISYYSQEEPEILQIFFATSKPSMNTHIGTTLWIDDVSVSGGNTGISEIIDQKYFSIYPNPIANKCNLKFYIPKTGVIDISLCALNGQKIKLIFNGLVYAEEENSIEIDMSEIPYGIYFISFNSEQYSIVKKVVVINYH